MKNVLKNICLLSIGIVSGILFIIIFNYNKDRAELSNNYNLEDINDDKIINNNNVIQEKESVTREKVNQDNNISLGDFNPGYEQKSTEGLTAEQVQQYLYGSRDIREIYDELRQLFPGEECFFTGDFNLKEYKEGCFKGIVEVKVRGRELEDDKACDIIFEFIVNSDFSITVLESTLKSGEMAYFYIEPTDNRYTQNGYQIRDYIYRQKDEERNTDIVINMPQIRGESGYDYEIINWQVKNRIKTYFEERGMGGINAEVDYKIKTLNDNLFSVAYYISYNQDDNIEQDIIGVTVCMKTNKLIPLSAIFLSSSIEESVNSFYIEKNKIAIISKSGKIHEFPMEKFYSYSYQTICKEMIDEAGNLLGKVYCELPYIEGTSKEVEAVNDMIGKAVLEFFREKDREYKERYFKGVNNYSYDEYKDILLGELWPEHNLECEIACNRSDYLSIKALKNKNSFSGFNFNLNTGERIELLDVLKIPEADINAVIQKKVMDDMKLKEDFWMEDGKREARYMEEAYQKVKDAKLSDWNFYFTCDGIYIGYNEIIDFNCKSWEEEEWNSVYLENMLFQ